MRLVGTRSSKIQSRRSGFTLVELAVALVLSSMLLAVLLALVAQLSRTQKRVKEKFEYLPWKVTFQKQLQSDYRQCNSILIKPKEIRLGGQFKFLDREEVWREGPASVRYFVSTDSNANWLFREEVSRVTGEKKRELVCQNVIGFKTEDRLSTDVAPGVLRLEILLDSSSSDTAGDSSGPRSHGAIHLSLVRHGGVDQ